MYISIVQLFSFHYRCDKQRQDFLTLSSSFCSMCVLKTSNMLDPPPYGEIAHLGVRGGAQSFNKRKVCVEKLSCLLREYVVVEPKNDTTSFAVNIEKELLIFILGFRQGTEVFCTSIPSISSSEIVSRCIPS